MNNSLDFSPSWASPPGDTIRSILFQRDVNIEEFSDLVGLDVDSCERMLSGYEKITKELARNIALVTEVSENFWLNREKKYRQQIESKRQKINNYYKTIEIYSQKIIIYRQKIKNYR